MIPKFELEKKDKKKKNRKKNRKENSLEGILETPYERSLAFPTLLSLNNPRECF